MLSEYEIEILARMRLMNEFKWCVSIIDKLQAELKEKQQECSDRASTEDSLLEWNEQLDARVKELESKLAESEKISEGRRQTLVEKAEELRNEWLRSERAEAAVDKLQAELECVQTDLDSASQHICRLDSMQDRVKELEAELANWERKEVARASDCCGQEQRATMAEKERDDLKLKLEDAEKRAGDYRAEREGARDMADVERKRADELKAQLETANQLRREWQSKCEEARSVNQKSLLGIADQVRIAEENSQLRAQVADLERTNHRRLCGCEESSGVFGCAIRCGCRCHELRAQVAALASRNTTLEDRIKCVCYHAPEQHGPSGCQATHKLNHCECPWDGIPASTADAAKAYEAKIRAEERERCVRVATEALCLEGADCKELLCEAARVTIAIRALGDET